MALLRSLTFLLVLGFGMSAKAQEAKLGGEITPVRNADSSDVVLMLCKTDDKTVGNCLTARPAATEGMTCGCGNPINHHNALGVLVKSQKYKLVCETSEGPKCISEVPGEKVAGEPCTCVGSGFVTMDAHGPSAARRLV